MILDTIRNTLETIAADTEYPMSGGVFYGLCNVNKLDEWNYFVFKRQKVNPSNHKSYTEIFQVHIVHEDYIAEGYSIEVMKALKEAIPGCSLSEDVTYDYSTKSDTNVVVEIATLTFKVPRKIDG